MGGHGGLNILPQKSWNVYNFENRERVRRDEEAAAREEQEKERRERERQAELRWQKLRGAKKQGPDISDVGGGGSEAGESPLEEEIAGSQEEAPRQIKMFGGCVIATRAVAVACTDGSKDRRNANILDWDEFERDLKDIGGSQHRVESRAREKGSWRTQEEKNIIDRARRELKERIKPVVREEPEDEHYKLGYGCLGKDKKRPWYTLSKSSIMNNEDDEFKGRCASEATGKDSGKRKKTLEELREERLRREQQEREKSRKLLFSKSGASLGFDAAGKHTYYNSSFGNASGKRTYYNSSFGNARY